MKAFFKLATAVMAFVLTTNYSVAQEIPSQENWANSKQFIQMPNGSRLAYVAMGNPQGQATLLIHGYTDNSRSWSLLAPYLKDRQLIAIDLRGHGRSDAPECCFSVLDFAHDAVAMMDALHIEKADIIGHSLGSLTAQVIAATRPERVNKLVLISSTVDAQAGSGSWMWDNISTLQFPVDPDGQFIKDWYANPNPVDETYLQYERRESAAVPERVWQGALHGLAVTNLQPISPLVHSPVQILWGDQDALFDSRHQADLKAAYPAAEFHVFEGAGHNMFWEFPEKAATIIRAFLGS